MDREQLKTIKSNVKNRLVQVTTEIKRVETQISNLDMNFNRFNNKAKEAVKLGRNDIAERILKKKNRRMERITTLEEHLSQLKQTKKELIKIRDRIDEMLMETETGTVMMETELSIPEVPRIPSV